MRIAIIMEGGIVQNITADGPIDFDVIVIDYDTEGADAADITPIAQTDGSLSTAFVGFPYVDVTEPAAWWEQFDEA